MEQCTCCRLVSAKDLYSKQYEIVSSEITGGVPVYNHPGTGKECPAQSVRYKQRRQTGNEEI
jgi:hypothetical protein